MTADNGKPSISVLMTVYNAEDFIVQCVESVLNQSYRNFEFIIVDDGSTDNTPNILRNFNDPRIKLIFNQINIGQTRSLNVGLEIAQGDYIARHDADDYSEPERFDLQIKYMDDHPNTGLLGTSYHVVDRTGNILDTVSLPQTNDELQKRLLRGNIFSHGSVLMRKSILDEVGGYEEQYQVTQDYDLWLRIAERTELAALKQPLYNFRFDSRSISRKKRGLQLAFRQQAYEAALSRRASGADNTINIDQDHSETADNQYVIDAKWGGYLYYASGYKEEAADALQKAGQSYAQRQDSDFLWNDWLVSRAHAISDLRKSLEEGEKFISWAYQILSQYLDMGDISKVRGRFFAEQFFRTQNLPNYINPIFCMVKALQFDRSWILNRGFLNLSFRSGLQFLFNRNK